MNYLIIVLKNKRRQHFLLWIFKIKQSLSSTSENLTTLLTPIHIRLTPSYLVHVDANFENDAEFFCKIPTSNIHLHHPFPYTKTNKVSHKVKYLLIILIHFRPVSHFYTPWKRQKSFGFWMFSGGIEMWHWTEMG